MKTNEEYRLLEQKLYECENELALADLKVRKLDKRAAELEQLRDNDTERLATVSARVLELEQQNLELLATIEKKNKAIEYAHESLLLRDLMPKCQLLLDRALKTNPSTDPLAKRDQKRDAALLRVAVRSFRGPFEALPRYVEECARLRESGEWNPTLEVKP